MGNGAIAARGAESVGAEDLTRGLMLMRASTLKIVRLQLAMERRDRQVAIEAVDDLVMLDGKIRDFLDHLPGDGTAVPPDQQDLNRQRSVLAREKLALAAGTTGRKVQAEARPWSEPALPPPAVAVEVIEEVVTEEAPALALHDYRRSEEQAAPRRVWPLLLAGLVLLCLMAAGAAFFLWPAEAEQLIQQAPGMIGDLS